MRGFAGLSPRTRCLRFLSPKPRLSGSEARYLTEIDGEDHLALGASVPGRDGEEEGLGVARFERLREEPEVAEAYPSGSSRGPANETAADRVIGGL